MCTYMHLFMLNYMYTHQIWNMYLLCLFIVLQPAPKKLKLFSFMNTSPQHTHPVDIALTMRKELIEYLQTSQVEYEDDPLEWWMSHAMQFPHAARTAKTVLSIPASSAPVERIFSTAGKIFRPERTRLSAEKFEQLVFIKCNKWNWHWHRQLLTLHCIGRVDIWYAAFSFVQ